MPKVFRTARFDELLGGDRCRWLRHVLCVAHADHVLRVLGLALDAALALRDHERLEAFGAQAAQDVDGRDVRIALGAALVLAGCEDRGATDRIC